ncbi:MAG: hypothetical protein KDH96_02630 [Candidatus Riesia sp.]|nr:hypothetical protein [Candidatus Riesia sp.]
MNLKQRLEDYLCVCPYPDAAMQLKEIIKDSERICEKCLNNSILCVEQVYRVKETKEELIVSPYFLYCDACKNLYGCITNSVDSKVKDKLGLILPDDDDLT